MRQTHRFSSAVLAHYKGEGFVELDNDLILGAEAADSLYQHLVNGARHDDSVAAAANPRAGYKHSLALPVAWCCLNSHPEVENMLRVWREWISACCICAVLALYITQNSNCPVYNL